MPKLNAVDEFGDLYLKVMVNVPYDLTESEKDQLEKMAKRRGLR
jgi:DnaJ-class molecular chaperone